MTNFEEAFEITGHGLFNHIVLVTCGLILLYVMAESLGTGYIITLAECDLQLNVSQKGFVNAAAFIGIFTTAIFWGYLSDRYGRRKVMLPTILIAAASSFLSSLSVNFVSLFWLRFLTGCLISASSATVYAYLGEMHNNSHRAAAITWGSLAIALSFIDLPGMAWLILAKHWSFSIGDMKIVPWRAYIWTWTIPGLIAWFVLVFLPESPRYLISARGPEAALPVLAKIYAINHRKKKEDYPVKNIVIKQRQYFKLGFKYAMRNFIYLVRPPLFRCVIISHISMFLVFLISSGLYTWVPNIFNELLYNIDSSLSVCSLMSAKVRAKSPSVLKHDCEETRLHFLLYPVSIALGVVSALVYLAIGYSIQKIGKRKIYSTVLSVFATMTAISSIVPQPKIAMILMMFGLSTVTTGSILAAIVVEVFPTSVRALALCTLYMAGRLGAAVGANVLGLAMKDHCEVVFLTAAFGNALSPLLILLWPDPKKVRRIMEDNDFVY